MVSKTALMVALIAFVYFKPLSCVVLKGRNELAELSQGLFDAMFQDMDLTLREMGVGDMGVGKRVKFMSEAYMGRLTAYDKALQQEDNTALVDALHRNLYREGEVTGDAELSRIRCAKYTNALNRSLMRVLLRLQKTQLFSLFDVLRGPHNDR